MTVNRDRRRQQEYSKSRLRQSYRELHDGTVEEQAADYIFQDVVNDSATIDFQYSTSPRSLTAIVIDDSITNVKLRNSSSLSVIGRSANSTGDPADIQASSTGDVLWYNGTSLQFSALPSEQVTFDNSNSGLSATDVKAALEELEDASVIDYDNGGGTETLSITNPGAETGDTTGWTLDQGTISIATNRVHSGTYSFVVNANPESMYQDLSVPSVTESSIDAGTATLDTTYWHRSDGSSDVGQMQIEYYDSGMSLLNSTADALKQATNADENGFEERGLSGESIPVSTRTIRIIIYGENNWSWFDDISAQINWSGALSSTNVQDAIDELEGRTDGLSHPQVMARISLGV